MRTDVTYLERVPYAMILSSSPRIMGGFAAPAVVPSWDGVWPIAGATAPRVIPPANAAPPLSSSRRSRRFEAIDAPPTDEADKKVGCRRSRVYADQGMHGWNRRYRFEAVSRPCHASAPTCVPMRAARELPRGRAVPCHAGCFSPSL